MQNLGFGLEVTAVSIIAVFLTLYLLSVLVDLFKLFLAPKKKESVQPKAVTPVKVTETEVDSSDELVAVITAAITAYEQSK